MYSFFSSCCKAYFVLTLIYLSDSVFCISSGSKGFDKVLQFQIIETKDDSKANGNRYKIFWNLLKQQFLTLHMRIQVQIWNWQSNERTCQERTCYFSYIDCFGLVNTRSINTGHFIKQFQSLNRYDRISLGSKFDFSA